MHGENLVKQLLLSTAILLAGCASNYSLAIEKDFSDREIYLIELAIDEWITACDCYDAAVFVHYGFDNGDYGLTTEEWRLPRDHSVMWRILSNEPIYEDIAKQIGPFNGLHYNGNILLVADKFKYDDNFFSVFLHELGHLYGLDHLNHGIMKSNNYWSNCIDPDALRHFCLMHNCGPNARTTCQR